VNDRRSPKVLCIGEILWDRLPSGKKIGGAPLNVAYHLSQLGCSAWPVSCVGDDPLGHELLNEIEAKDVATDLIGKSADRPTGVVDVALEQGSPTFHIAEDSAWDYIEIADELDENCLPVDAVIYGSLAQRKPHNRETLQKLFRQTPAALKVFDVNLRPPYDCHDRVWGLASDAQLFKLNDEEAVRLLDDSSAAMDLEASARKLQKRVGCERVCITAGSKGAGLLDSNTWYRVDAVATDVRDTVGAGDSFLAALVHGLLVVPDQAGAALDRAATLAAFVAGSDGAAPDYTPDDLF